MPKISEQVVRRFSELEVRVRAIQMRQEGGEDSTRHAEPEAFYAWASSAMNAIDKYTGVKYKNTRGSGLAICHKLQ